MTLIKQWTQFYPFGHKMHIHLDTKCISIWTHYYFFLVPQTPIKWEDEKVIHTPITVSNKGF